MEAKEQGRKEQEEHKQESSPSKPRQEAGGLRINQSRGGREGRGSERGNSSSVRSKSLSSKDGGREGGRRGSIENIASVKERIENYMNMAAAEPQQQPPVTPTSPPSQPGNRPKSILVSR